MTGFRLPDATKLEKEYDELKNRYEELMIVVKEKLIKEINEQKIKYLEIYKRKQMKTFSSFYDKISRQKITEDYFNNVEDMAGIRLICTYYSDLKLIEQLIEKNFQVIRKEHKTFPQGVDPTGYQSDHFILKLQKNSINVNDPLVDKQITELKCEIQIRTVLMHAWASVSHNVNYKQDVGLGDDYDREMFALSTLFYFADQRFDAYKKIREKKSGKITKTIKMEMNKKVTGKSLTDYLQMKFSDRPEIRSISVISIKKQLVGMGYKTLKDLDNKINKAYKVFEDYEINFPPNKPGSKYDGIGVLRICLALTDKQNKNSNEFYVNDISKYRKMLSIFESL